MTEEGAGWLDRIEDGIVAVANGRVSFVNAAAARLLEIDPARVTGLPLIVAARDHRLEQAHLNRETVEVNTRGRTLLVRGSSDGLVLHDLTELHRAREDARELLAVISHELRTPVAVVRSTLEALDYALPEEKKRRLLARAGSETERLIRLLEDLTVEVRPPRLRRLSLEEVAGRAIALLGDRFREAEVHLQTDLAPVTLRADEDKLLQALLNLLENAAVHGPDAGVIRLATVEADSGWIGVVVQDEGESLPEEVFERLFEPHSAPAHGGRRPGSAGLGLYIVRSIARRWGGKAWGRPLPDGNEFGFTVQLG